MTAAILVRHNMEVAHRLLLLPGKCQNIHGHSMGVELELYGELDDRGLLGGLDFGEVKRAFRAHLDAEYDHRLLLNEADPLVSANLPGASGCPADPTIENIADWIAQWAGEQFEELEGGLVTVAETRTNGARATWSAQ